MLYYVYFGLGIFLGFGISAIIEMAKSDKKELERFNKVHNTNYDIDTWKLYSYKIQKKHDLFEGEWLNGNNIYRTRK